MYVHKNQLLPMNEYKKELQKQKLAVIRQISSKLDYQVRKKIVFVFSFKG